MLVTKMNYTRANQPQQILSSQISAIKQTENKAVFVGYGGKFSCYDLNNKSKIYEKKVSNSHLYALSILVENGQTFALTGGFEKEIDKVNLETGDKELFLSFSNIVKFQQFSPDKMLLAVGDGGGALQIINPITKQQICAHQGTTKWSGCFSKNNTLYYGGWHGETH